MNPPLIRKARTRCDLTGFRLAARSAQVLSLGRLACWRSSRPGARGLSARFNTLFLSRAPRLCPVAVDITMLTRRKLRLEEVYSERLSQKHFQRQLLISAMRFLKLSRFLNPKQLRLDSAVYSFNRTVGEIILDAVKNSCHVLLQGGDGRVHVLTRTTVVFQNINEPLPVFFFSALNTS